MGRKRFEVGADLVANVAARGGAVGANDHGIHLVGHTELGGHDWFLIKDSGRSSRRGNHKGYYFMRGDFVRLKMLTISVHRDAVSELLAKFE